LSPSIPDIDDSDRESEQTPAVDNCLNKVCHGIRFSGEQRKKRFDAGEPEVEAVYRKRASPRDGHPVNQL
jgi:hypothetical protein